MLTTGILDPERETSLDKVFATLGLPVRRFQAAVGTGRAAEVIDLNVNGVCVTLIPASSSPRAARSSGTAISSPPGLGLMPTGDRNRRGIRRSGRRLGCSRSLVRQVSRAQGLGDSFNRGRLAAKSGPAPASGRFRPAVPANSPCYCRAKRLLRPRGLAKANSMRMRASRTHGESSVPAILTVALTASGRRGLHPDSSPKQRPRTPAGTSGWRRWPRPCSARRCLGAEKMTRRCGTAPPAARRER